MAEYKTAEASTHLEIWVDCPYCDNYQNVFEELCEFLVEDLRAEDCDREIKCDDKDCLKTFIVNTVTY